MIYSVEQVPKLLGDNSDGTSSFLNGKITYQDTAIQIEQGMAEQLKPITLVHEALHGILEQAGITDEAENIIVALGYGVVALMRNNPALVAYILDGEQ